jgi:hypothetical protein
MAFQIMVQLTPIQVSTSIYNLIGNPYPSAISADLFLSDLPNVAAVECYYLFMDTYTDNSQSV